MQTCDYVALLVASLETQQVTKYLEFFFLFAAVVRRVSEGVRPPVQPVSLEIN